MLLGISEARRRLSRLVDLVLAGEDVIIGDGSTPLVRLVPVSPSSEKGEAHEILKWLKAHRLPQHARRSADEIDADIKALRES